jgi:regulator of sirC expression with transglutaminase-like and TPR domain
VHEGLFKEFGRHAASADAELALPALLIARLEHPRLDPTPYVAELDALGAVARRRLGTLRGNPPPRARAEALSKLLFEDEGFAGNRDAYDDPRNSFLNDVLDRRTGIPITLALVYLEVARRAGVAAEGVNFPGHFLLRCAPPGEPAIIIDPFNGGAVLSPADCRSLLREHVGETATFGPELFEPADKPAILRRMLANLKRVYVHLRSFQQARHATEMLLTIDPLARTELRDRGLLAYHLNDFGAALRDLESYLRLAGDDRASGGREEDEQIWEHVKALRRRVASLN